MPRVPRSHLVIPPLAFVTRGVKRTRGVKFAEVDGMSLRLDIYRPADDDPDDQHIQPAVIQVHGGGWLAGSRFEQGIPLLNHMANIGWVGFNIDYRLSPQATWPDHIVDVKRAIAWVRENAEELGIDPEMICLTGGSAGGHLTALAALTPGDPDFQPGFEEADTSVAAAVPFYGVFDLTDANGFYYPQLRSYVFEKLVFKQPYAEAESALPGRVADLPGARGRAALPRHPRRAGHPRPGRGRPALRRAAEGRFARAGPLRGAARGGARVRHLAVGANRADLGGHRPIPHRRRRAPRAGADRGRFSRPTSLTRRSTDEED